MSWNSRAFVSYGSPIVIFGAFYALSHRTAFQTLLLVMWTSHFLKRLLETRYVHIYSPGKEMHGCFTSSANIFYIVFALAIGFQCSQDSYAGRFTDNTATLVAVFYLTILLNATHHILLRQLKTSQKGNQRTFPSAFMFSIVACPHYTFEMCTWLFFALVSNTLASWAFFAATTLLLLRWSKQRHLRYQQMSGYPSYRKALIPFIY